MRKVYLEGTLGQEFGTGFSVSGRTPTDVLRCLEANFGDPFRKYLIKAHEDNVGFIIEVAGKDISLEEMLMPAAEGDLIITPVPAGSKSGGAKILAAIAITIATAGAYGAFATVHTATASGALGTGLVASSGSMAGIGAGLAAAAATPVGLIALSVAVNLALSGINQMMMPDPSSDSDQNSSYLFNGAEQNIVEGDPVPVLYGRLRVPGQPIAFEVVAGSRVLGSTGVVSSISLDTAVDVIDDDAAATYITSTGETAPVIINSGGGTSGGSSSGGTPKGGSGLNQV